MARPSRRDRKLGLVHWASAAIVLAVVLIFASLPFAANRDGGANDPSHLQAASWFNTLGATETAYCLKPVNNQTLTLNSTEYIVQTNLSALSTPACSAKDPRYGVAFAEYNASRLSLVWMLADNNTTGSSPGALVTNGNFTYTTSYVPVYGSMNGGIGSKTSILWWNVTSSAPYSIHVTEYVCGWENSCSGGPGGAGPGNFGTATGSGPCPVGGSAPQIYVWDSVCFEKNYPIRYPHPDVAYYQIYTSLNAIVAGTALKHIQMGSTWVSSFGSFTPVVIGILIGAAIGSVGGGWSAVAGAIIGAAVTAVSTYAFNVQYQDEANAIWFWINNGFYNALNNVPWYVAIGGPAAVYFYLSLQLSELRIGNTWFINQNGMTGP
jgi:hypothetical protein